MWSDYKDIPSPLWMAAFPILTRSLKTLGFICALLCFAHSGWGQTAGDLDGDDIVWMKDFTIIAEQWLRSDCDDPNWCEGADIDLDGVVDPNDLVVLTSNWLENIEKYTHIELEKTYSSVGQDEDGRVWNTGDFLFGTGENPTGGDSTLRLGDYKNEELVNGYRSIVSFDIASDPLPLDADILSATLELTRGSETGDDPFVWGGECLIDADSPFLGETEALYRHDWQDIAGAEATASFDYAADPGTGNKIVSTEFDQNGLNIINYNSKTQFRVYFETIHNSGNSISNWLGFWSGEAVNEADKPKLNVRFVTIRRPAIDYTSQAGYDGRVWDLNGSGEGVANASVDSTSYALRLGDYYDTPSTNSYGYRNILSFDTSEVPGYFPENYSIISVKLEMTCGYKDYSSCPFSSWGGNCYIDIANPYFGISANLDNGDWQATASATAVARFTTEPAAQATMVSTEFNAEGLSYINTSGTTQLRVYFQNQTNSDTNIDFLGFYAGETAGKEPTLVITYKLEDPE
ncbi:MAG: hypothetical protein JW860_06925 [Sedimentisphaerales bacterium]|nr:hypothetical protein [Sedimentisphaerales bacterium]